LKISFHFSQSLYSTFVCSKHLNSRADRAAICASRRMCDLLFNPLLKQKLNMSAVNILYFITPTATCFDFFQPKLSEPCTRIIRRCNVQQCN